MSITSYSLFHTIFYAYRHPLDSLDPGGFIETSYLFTLIVFYTYILFYFYAYRLLSVNYFSFKNIH